MANPYFGLQDWTFRRFPELFGTPGYPPTQPDVPTVVDEPDVVRPDAPDQPRTYPFNPMNVTRNYPSVGRGEVAAPSPENPPAAVAPEGEPPEDLALPRVAPNLGRAIGSMPWTSQVERPSETPGGKSEMVPQEGIATVKQYPGFRGVSVSGETPSMENPPTGTASWTPGLAGAAPSATALRMGLAPGQGPGTYNSATGVFTSRAQQEAEATKRGTALGLQDVAAEQAAAPRRQAMANLENYLLREESSGDPKRIAGAFALREAFQKSLGPITNLASGAAAIQGNRVIAVNPKVAEPGAHEVVRTRPDGTVIITSTVTGETRLGTGPGAQPIKTAQPYTPEIAELNAVANEFPGWKVGMVPTPAHQRRAREYRIATQGETAAQKVKDVFEARQNLPLNEKAPFWLHPSTGLPASPSMTPEDARNQGFVPATTKGLDAAATARAALVQLNEYDSLIEKLLTKQSSDPILGLFRVQGNRALLSILRASGDPDAKRLEALFGAIATLARATGDTANIAVQERQFLKEFLGGEADTIESARAKNAQARRILEGVVMGRGLPVQKGGTGDLSKIPPPPNPENPRNVKVNGVPQYWNGSGWEKPR